MIWFPCTQIESNKLKSGNELLEIAKIYKNFPWYRGGKSPCRNNFKSLVTEGC